MSCGYQGHEFGGHYDSLCIDGVLWDADSCDEPGGPLYSGGDIPCPRCNTAAFLASALQDAIDGGCGLAMFTPHVAMTSWEAAIAKARRENAEAAEGYLRTVPPFVTDDWPDREAVFANPAAWGDTIEREWRYEEPVLVAPEFGKPACGLPYVAGLMIGAVLLVLLLCALFAIAFCLGPVDRAGRF